MKDNLTEMRETATKWGNRYDSACLLLIAAIATCALGVFFGVVSWK